MQNKLRNRRAERHKAGKRTPQVKVAKACRMSENRYWKIENDELDPSAREIEALAKFFGADPAVLFPELSGREPVSEV
jgi:transcriptional regulator with XRE-family HTH domain